MIRLRDPHDSSVAQLVFVSAFSHSLDPKRTLAQFAARTAPISYTLGAGAFFCCCSDGSIGYQACIGIFLAVAAVMLVLPRGIDWACAVSWHFPF